MTTTASIRAKATRGGSHYLRELFLERKGRNPAYSMRAFARDLGVSQALVSLILSDKRPLTGRQAVRMGAVLGLSPQESKRLVESTFPGSAQGPRDPRHRSGRARFKDESLDRFKTISQWYHLAILDLCTTRGFVLSPEWIARRLGISTAEVRSAVGRLLGLGLLKEERGTLRKVSSKIKYPTQRSELAVRTFHKQMIAKALDALNEASLPAFERREISSMTMAARSDRIPEARKRIQRFQRSLALFLTDGDCDEVFQLNVQLFPLTKNTEREKK